MLLALAFSVKLLPPLSEIMELRIVVHENLYLLAGIVEGVACLGVKQGDVGIVRFCRSRFHSLCTADELADVESSNGNRQQAYRGEYGETSAHVVWNDVCSIALLGSELAERALMLVGDGNDMLRCVFLAFLSLKHLLEQTESDCRFCRSTRF